MVPQISDATTTVNFNTVDDFTFKGITEKFSKHNYQSGTGQQVVDWGVKTQIYQLSLSLKNTSLTVTAFHKWEVLETLLDTDTGTAGDENRIGYQRRFEFARPDGGADIALNGKVTRMTLQKIGGGSEVELLVDITFSIDTLSPQVGSIAAETATTTSSTTAQTENITDGTNTVTFKTLGMVNIIITLDGHKTITAPDNEGQIVVDVGKRGKLYSFTYQLVDIGGGDSAYTQFETLRDTIWKASITTYGYQRKLTFVIPGSDGENKVLNGKMTNLTAVIEMGRDVTQVHGTFDFLIDTKSTPVP